MNLDKLTSIVGDRMLRLLLQHVKYQLIDEDMNLAVIMETEDGRKTIEKI